MFFSDEVLEEIRESNNIKDVIASYLKLTPKGNGYFAICPFHNEKTPSFSVNENKQLYHCFGCGESGNVITFIMKMENYDFIDAVKNLANRAHISLDEIKTNNKGEYEKKHKEKKDLQEIHNISGRYFYDNLQSEFGQNCKKYIMKRNIKKNIQRKYGLGFSDNPKNNLYNFLKSKGYSEDLILKSGLVVNKNGKRYDRFFNRLMFPIFNVQGGIIAFGGRVLDSGMPKYLNSPETVLFSKSNVLYNLNFARKTNLEEFVLVEGYLDVIAMYQNGIKNIVAPLGTAFNNGHTKILKRYAKSIIILFDSDEAGVKATLKAIPLLEKEGLKIKVLKLQNANDPDEFIEKFGVDKLKYLLKNCESSIMFEINILKNKFDLKILSEKIEFIKNVILILNKVQSNVERNLYIKEIVKITNIDEKSLIEDIHIKKEIKLINKENITIDKNKNNISKGIENIIYILAHNKKFIEPIKKILPVNYILDEDYKKVLQLIYKGIISPSAVVSNFYEADKQKKIARIFNTAIEFNIEDIEKTINDQCKVILSNYISVSSLEATSGEQLKEINKLRKKINDMYINL